VTSSAAKFFDGQSAEQPSLDTLLNINGVDAVYPDQDEWEPTWSRGSPLLHVELRKWANILIVVPLSAITLAKMAMGFADFSFRSSGHGTPLAW
jgi:phosphopantothenoylcysteine decarboxylase